MSRFLVWSDLHVEFWGDIPRIDRRDDIDGLLIAGDIHTRTRHVDMALLAWDMLRVPVVMIRGNHEFYGREMPEIIADDRKRFREIRKLGADIHLLEGSDIEIAGTRIIGATLWTGFDLWPGRERAAREATERSMNDFLEIRTNPVRFLSSGDMISMHHHDREAILSLADRPFPGPTIVMSHHVPIMEMVPAARFQGSDHRRLSVSGYASNLWPDIRHLDIDAWVSGHSHDPVDMRMEGMERDIRFVSNPRGYPNEGLPFDPNFTIEVRGRLEPALTIDPEMEDQP